ncbi:MAG: DUF4942 domain-containing protein [Lentisphaeria bacterium]|nr:DUF4942 domain-containing protein [Lentisphaeria bacterium]
MNKQTADLIECLKEAGEDFEFYPTTKAMVKTIWEHATDTGHYDHRVHWDLLDIGCGTCNFRKWIEELNREERMKHTEDTLKHRDYEVRTLELHEYCVMEKSTVLLQRLDPKTIVLGTDFHEATLIDKDVDTVFCNPPYSEFEEWTARIITESRAKRIYLVIPERWKKSEMIQTALKTVKAPPRRDGSDGMEKVVQVIGHADFLNAERAARAKVDILFIDKQYTDRDSGFDSFFDAVFGMDQEDLDAREAEFVEADREEKRLKAELAAGKNKVEVLCGGYNAARDELFNIFKVIAGIDANVLKSVGVNRDSVKEALKKKFYGLKHIYWKSAFGCLDEITSRLTSESRDRMLGRFADLNTVDFTPSNIYALIIWVIKNYNVYAEEQMLELFYALSSKENVQNYVSNKRVFDEYCSRWGTRDERPTHYTLDYRIICTRNALPGREHWGDLFDRMRQKITDICTVANNLGFPNAGIYVPPCYGELGSVLEKDTGKTLFEFRCYKNENVHIKFSVEFMKAFNVAVARKLGWIRKPEDIRKEFAAPEMADGAEIYFDRFNSCAAIDINRAAALMLPA